MNYVVELVEINLSRINIADTNELAEAVKSKREDSGGTSLPDGPRRQNAWGAFLFWREIGIMWDQKLG